MNLQNIVGLEQDRHALNVLFASFFNKVGETEHRNKKVAGVN